MSSRLRVALVHHLDVLDPLTWSGTPRALLRALRRRGVEVLPVSPLDRATSEQDLRRHARYAREGQLYHLDSTPRAVAGYARQVERAARDLNPDVILGVNPIALADLNVKTPVVLWTDATYALLHDTYPSFTRVCAESVVRGWQVDASALARCSLTLYSSEWAARSAREDLGVPAELVGVVPYGANLDEPP
ncbi:glycosyltransferase, partial [Deinococcus pimensis]|uniref:glycosyltransferase n=1 Tax=Deinococcus pimensis TaxID=309888 RepID=UPI000483A578